MAAFGFNFTKDLARVVVTVNAIADPAAAPLLATYIKASGDVVDLINHSNPLGAAREEVNVQSPASYALVAELARYAAVQSKDSQTTSNRAGTLTEAVDLGTLLLLVLILLFFWYLDSRSDTERRREVERTEARFRGIVARGSRRGVAGRPRGRGDLRQRVDARRAGLRRRRGRPPGLHRPLPLRRARRADPVAGRGLRGPRRVRRRRPWR